MIVGKDGCATSTAEQCDRGEDVLRMERERWGCVGVEVEEAKIQRVNIRACLRGLRLASSFLDR
jgi:hypothetical protein